MQDKQSKVPGPTVPQYLYSSIIEVKRHLHVHNNKQTKRTFL